MLAEDDEGGDRPEALVEDLIASGMARLLDELFGPQLLQVVGGLAHAVVTTG